MEPYYKQDGITIYHGDCYDILPQLPKIDLLLTDPPYGINADKFSNGQNLNRKDGWNREESTSKKIRKNRLQRLNGGGGKLKNRILNTSKIDWDYERPKKEYWDELFRISKNQFVWGFNYFIDFLYPSRGVYVWNKKQPWENFSQAELGWTSFDKPARLFDCSNTGGRNKEIKIHPTQKPVIIYKDILTWIAEKGWTIFDSHTGSRSLGIACYDLGFDFEGCENDKIIWEAQETRFQDHIKQDELFDKSEYQELIFKE